MGLRLHSAMIPTVGNGGFCASIARVEKDVDKAHIRRHMDSAAQHYGKYLYYMIFHYPYGVAAPVDIHTVLNLC